MNDGCNINYIHHVNTGKPTIVLSHSLGCDLTMWDSQITTLKEHYSVLLYDMRGHGGSTVFPGFYSMDRLGCDVVQLLDSLEIEKVHFCGLSIGGMIGQWLAFHEKDRLKSLILANTAPRISPSSLWQQRINTVLAQGLDVIWENILEKWFTPSFIENSPEIIDKTRAMFLRIDPKGYAGCCAAIRDSDMRNYASENNIPTLVLAGSYDQATSVEQSEYLVEQYRQAQLLKLDAAHLSNIEKPKIFNKALLDFLK